MHQVMPLNMNWLTHVCRWSVEVKDTEGQTDISYYAMSNNAICTSRKQQEKCKESMS